MNETVSIPEHTLFRLLDLEIDLGRQTLKRGDEPIPLPNLSFRLLASLVRHAPDTLSKDELVREVWGEVVVGDETLSQRVRLLRQALGEDGQDPRYISSVRGRGYRLLCDIEPVQERSHGPAQSSHPTASQTTHGSTRRLTWLAAALAVAGLLMWGIWSMVSHKPGAPAAADINSIAVLPFVDMSPAGDHGYFADGMQEELLNRLVQLDRLKVASRTSVEAYRSTDKSLPEIAQELGVGAVIESSVRIADDRVRITVQLIDGATDRHLWSDVYDRELSVENVFSIQEEVAEQIGKALALEYPGDGAPAPVLLPTTSIEAYNAYLLGRAHTFAQTPEDLDRAIALLREAVDIDPEFAEAWATLGWAYSFGGTLYGRQPPRDVYPEAKQAVMRALAIDNELSDARSLYADILSWYDWDFEAAEREYVKTQALDPGNVLGYVLFLSTQLRHEEAIALIEETIERYPDSAYVHINAAWTFLRARDYERAIIEAELAPLHTDARAVLGFAYLRMGDTGRAIEEFETDLRLNGRRPRQLASLASAYFESGRQQEARQLFQELTAIADTGYVSPEIVAEVHFAAGEIDAAFDVLEQVIEVRSRGAIFLQTDPRLDEFRDDPRYLALIDAVGF